MSPVPAGRRELAAAGRAEPAESLLGDQGQRSTRDSTIINKRVPACDAMPLFEAALAAGEISGGHVDAVAAVLTGLGRRDPCRVHRRTTRAAGRGTSGTGRGVPGRVPEPGPVPHRPTRPAHAGPTPKPQNSNVNGPRRRSANGSTSESRMHHTHIELDPVRGAKLNKALADMLRRHRAIETNTGVPWNQLEVDSFLNGIDRAVTTKPVTGNPSGSDANAATAAAITELTATAAGLPVHRGSADPRDRGLHRPAHPARRAARTQHLRDLRRHPHPGVARCGACAATPTSSPTSSTATARSPTSARSTRTVTRAQRRKLRAHPQNLRRRRLPRARSSSARSTTSSSGASTDEPTSPIWSRSAPDTTTSPTKAAGH